MPTPTLIQSVVPAVVTATSVTATITPSPGNTLIAYAEVGATGALISISDNVNNTATNGPHYALDVPTVTGASGTSYSIQRFTGVAGVSTIVTLLWGGSASALRLVVQEWANLDGLIPFEQSPTIATGTSTTPTANATGALAETGELVVAWSFTTAASPAWVAGSGFTLDPNIATNKAYMAEYMVAGSTSAVTAGFTNASGTWSVVAVAYRSAHTRKVLALTNTGATTFVAPPDWPGVADKAEVIGGGGAGSGPGAGTEGIGGGGGAYTYLNGLAIPNGASIQVGQGGNVAGASGTATWVISTSTLFARAGGGGSTGAAGLGGAASSCIPSNVANSGGNGGNPVSSATAGASGGGGAGGPFGAGGTAGGQNATGSTGGTGGGAGGGSTGVNGVTQSASNTGGTNGGTYSTQYGQIAGNGGAGGAAGGANVGGNGNGRVSPLPNTCGSGGGGGGSDGAGNGGSGGIGGAGAEWTDGTFFYGSGGGGGGSGAQTSGTGVSGGNGGLYGGGGGGVGAGGGTLNTAGKGAQGIIVLTYTPLTLASQFLPFSSTQFFVQDQVVVS